MLEVYKSILSCNFNHITYSMAVHIMFPVQVCFSEKWVISRMQKQPSSGDAKNAKVTNFGV